MIIFDDLFMQGATNNGTDTINSKGTNPKCNLSQRELPGVAKSRVSINYSGSLLDFAVVCLHTVCNLDHIASGPLRDLEKVRALKACAHLMKT